MPDNVLILCAAGLSFFAMVFSAVGLWGRVKSKDMESLRRAFAESRQQAPRQESPRKPEVNGYVGNQNIELAITGLRDEIRSLKDLLSAPAPKLEAVQTVTPMTGPPAVSDEAGFRERLIDEYNSLGQDVFRERFSAKLAQLDGNRSLKPHGAGSFWIVQSPLGVCYCVPRPRKITAILHENVGLKQLFKYTGYNPDGPDPNFRLEDPARVTLGLDGSWVVEQPGRLAITVEGIQ